MLKVMPVGLVNEEMLAEVPHDTFSKRRFQMGALLSIGYVALIILLGIIGKWNIAALSPNEVGDLLAGVCGPLAFLWLVLGFLQQGEELRSSNIALRIQAAELRSSVEQQRELVDVTKQQYELEVAARKAREESAEPSFVLRSLDSTYDIGAVRNNFSIFNIGGTAIDLRIIYDGHEISRCGRLMSAEHQFSIVLPRKTEPPSTTLIINFFDRAGFTYDGDFDLKVESSGGDWTLSYDSALIDDAETTAATEVGP